MPKLQAVALVVVLTASGASAQDGAKVHRDLLVETMVVIVIDGVTAAVPGPAKLPVQLAGEVIKSLETAPGLAGRWELNRELTQGDTLFWWNLVDGSWSRHLPERRKEQSGLAKGAWIPSAPPSSMTLPLGERPPSGLEHYYTFTGTVPVTGVHLNLGSGQSLNELMWALAKRYADRLASLQDAPSQPRPERAPAGQIRAPSGSHGWELQSGRDGRRERSLFDGLDRLGRDGSTESSESTESSSGGDGSIESSPRQPSLPSPDPPRDRTEPSEPSVQGPPIGRLP